MNTVTRYQELLMEEVETLKPVKVYKNGSIYRFTYGGKLNICHIVNWIYKDATIYLQRKFNIADEIINSYNNSLKKYTSLYRGVSKRKLSNNWQAQISANKKKYALGVFQTEIEAAKAYDSFIIKNNLDLNKLNFTNEARI